MEQEEENFCFARAVAPDESDKVVPNIATPKDVTDQVINQASNVHLCIASSSCMPTDEKGEAGRDANINSTSLVDMMRRHQIDIGQDIAFPEQILCKNEPCDVYIDVSNIWHATSNMNFFEEVKTLLGWTDETLGIRIQWTKLLTYTLGDLPPTSTVSAFGSVRVVGQNANSVEWLTSKSRKVRIKDQDLLDRSHIRPHEFTGEAKRILARFQFHISSQEKKSPMKLYFRPRDDKEKAVDTSLVAQALEDFYSSRQSNRTVVVFTSDSDFLPLYEILCKKKVRVIIFCWSKSTNSSVTEGIRNKHFSFHYLDSLKHQICQVFPLHSASLWTWRIADMKDRNLPERFILNAVQKEIGDRIGCFIGWDDEKASFRQYSLNTLNQDQMTDRMNRIKEVLQTFLKPDSEIQKGSFSPKTKEQLAKEAAEAYRNDELTSIVLGVVEKFQKSSRQVHTKAE